MAKKTRADIEAEKLERERRFFDLLIKERLPVPVKEFQFHPRRKWVFDYAWPAHMVALEVEGGVYISGRHNSPTGFLDDMVKYNTAAIMGWALVRCTPQELVKIKATVLVRSALTRSIEPWNELIVKRKGK